MNRSAFLLRRLKAGKIVGFGILSSLITAQGSLLSEAPGLSGAAQAALVAHYDGRVNVARQPGSTAVTSWTPVDGAGNALPAMTVTQTGSGRDIIRHDGNKLFFSSSNATTSRQLQGNLVSPAGRSYTVLWRGRHLTPAPSEGSGNYVYNIGGEISHQRDVTGTTPAIELYDGSTTYRGADISGYDNRTTVWSTIYNINTHVARANGVNLNVPGTPNYNLTNNPAIVIGAFDTTGFNFNGELLHLLIFNTALSDADRLLVEGYLANTPPASVVKIRLATPTAAELSWPAALTNYVLQFNDYLHGPDGWEDVSTPPATVDIENVVTNSFSSPAGFFRLTR